MKIFCKFPTVNISKLNLFISNMHCLGLHLDNFEGDFSQYYFQFSAPSDSRCSNSCIVAKYCPILTNGKLIYLASDDAQISKCTLRTSFVVQSHILFWIWIIILPFTCFNVILCCLLLS